MLTIGYIVAAIVILCLGFLIGRATVKSIEKNSEPEGLLTEIPKPDTDSFKTAIRQCDKWASQNNFQPHKLMEMDAGPQTVKIATWQDNNESRILVLYHTGKHNAYDLVTQFADGMSLTTSNSKDSHMLPTQPGKFIQSFSYLDLDRLLGEHIVGEAYVQKKFQTDKQTLSGNVMHDMIENMQAQMAYVKTLALWKIKSVYWYLFRRPFRSNTSVKSLYR